MMQVEYESNMQKTLKTCLYVNAALAVALSLYLFLIPAALRFCRGGAERVLEARRIMQRGRCRASHDDASGEE